MTSQSPTRVVPKHRKPAGYLIRVSARAGGSDDRDSSSPRAGIWSIRVVLPASYSQSTGLLPKLAGVIRAFLPWRGRLAARTFEALRARLCAQALAAIFSRYEGHRRLIRILAGAQYTTGKCFSLCVAFVNDCRQPANRIAYGLSFPPVLSFVPINHAHKKAWSWMHDEHGNSANRAIGVKNNV